MNQANVAALAKLLDVVLFPEFGDLEVSRLYAVELAARGVLVPAALTDDDLSYNGPFGFTPCSPDTESIDVADFRTALERIARGEPS